MLSLLGANGKHHVAVLVSHANVCIDRKIQHGEYLVLKVERTVVIW